MDHFAYLAMGIGNGAVYAALGLALVMTYKSSGVVNFATGAIALYTAYTYAYLRQGKLLNPIPGFDAKIDLGTKLSVGAAMAGALAIATVLGVLLYLIVFRPMRTAPALAKAVAAIGVMLVIQALISLQVKDDSPAVKAIFPSGTITIGGQRVTTDHFWLAAVVIGIAVCAALVLRYTRFGIATEAAAESEKGALVTGLSPNRIACANWALSSATAGLAGILIAPVATLSPFAYSLFLVPALAAALVGNFTSIGVTVGAGLVIGMLMSEVTKLQDVFDWLPRYGLGEAVPLVLILGFLLLRGQALPGRGALIRQDLGRAPRPNRLILPTVLGVAVAIAALYLTSGSLRLAVIMSMIFAIIALSQVVITGYAGQVSLAQLTLAGAGAFALARITADWGLPFPLAPLLAALVATVIGIVVGLPSLRVRGLPLMVATLALAVFLEQAWFQNPDLNGQSEQLKNMDDPTGAALRIPDPTLFGIDMAVGSGDGYRISFGVLCLTVLTLCALGVAFLRRSRLGAAMLAVRANERSAAASGINVGATKLIAFAVASFLAGLGGVLLAYQQTLAAASSYAVLAGIGLFAAFYIAGVTSVSGALLGGILAPGALMAFILDKYLHFGDFYMLATGILLILTVVTSPDGISGHLHRIPLPAWLRGRTRVATASATPATALLGEAEQPGDSAGIDGPDRTPVLSLNDVTVAYGPVTAVNSVDLDLRPGEIVGLIGPNGAGKTTLVDAISGFASSTGSITLGGESLIGLSPHRRARSGLGRSFQDVELYEELTVAENVSVGVARDEHDVAGTVTQALGLLEIADLADTMVADLSQGQRQLVSVARVLAGRPTVALLDEPAAGLDSTESRWLGERLRSAASRGVTMLLIDHDMDLVLRLCDRVIVLDLGEVVAAGPPELIRTDPSVIRAYLGSTGEHPGDVTTASEESQS
ncbi:putative amino acid ABC transporter permease protein [Gordonia araii NBRC 100433]|uniref:Putative amino acid ABC transporter permease protein n=1 Tax=Gordonia araii NBRC 100433 TaxID=1073574 RepID=G7H1W6_9ACTN|nr:branched-chain amino acid ABC transporter permease/ATP-binding protein [Gordonia araii]NNG97174.1 ATP-binding cassette domain-containing protein [Gordonia araii NBRC 100433]GAB09841.1 putative amino acid ABC transporter permease protein [Gordonia araii NBRC 100433]